jgi:hypothetical protein
MCFTRIEMDDSSKKRLDSPLGDKGYGASSGQMTLSLSPAETTGVHNALQKRAGGNM